MELPANYEAERSVLGGLLLDPSYLNDVAAVIDDPAAFYDPKHEAIYRAILQIVATGGRPDAVTVTDFLTKSGELGKWQRPTICHELTADVVSPVLAVAHASVIADAAIRRRLAIAGQAIADDAVAGIGRPDELVEKARKLVDESSHRVVLDTGYLFGAVDEIVHELQQGEAQVTRTGWNALNGLIGGLRPGALYIVGARPGVGKTVVGLNLAVKFAGLGSVGFVSLEMSRSELVKRAISAEAGVKLSALIDGRTSIVDMEMINSVKSVVDSWRLSILDNAESLSQILLYARTLHRKGDLKLLVVDYLQLMRGDRKAESRQQEVSEFSRALKLLAKELQIPVVALSQLNRESANRKNNEPLISDLRESGSLEQDADVVILLHREKTKARRLKMIVAKNRQGRQGEVTLNFEGEFCRIVDKPFDPLGVFTVAEDKESTDV